MCQTHFILSTNGKHNGRTVSQHSGTYSTESGTILKHLPVLDGWRGVAVLLVLGYHFFPFFPIGWIGVDLFFILSGFLITANLDLTASKRRYFRNFYGRRILRILPLYYLVLVIVFFLVPVISPSLISASFVELAEIKHVYFFLVANIYSAIHGWPDNILIVHLWSVCCEAQFYLIWPFVVQIFYPSKTRLLTFLVLMIVGALVFRIFTQDVGFPSIVARYSLFFSRMDAFACGAVGYICSIRFQPRYLLKLAALTGSFMFASIAFIAIKQGSWSYSDSFVSTIGLSMVAIMWFSFVLLTTVPAEARSQNISSFKKFAETVISSKLLRWCGKYSYGMYMFHLPVYYSVGKILSLFSSPAMFLKVSASFILTIVAAKLSYEFFESKFLLLKSKFSYAN